MKVVGGEREVEGSSKIAGVVESKYFTKDTKGGVVNESRGGTLCTTFME